MPRNKYFILHEFVNKLKGSGVFSDNISAEYYAYPYEHIRFFNIFNERAYKEMCDLAKKICSKIKDDNYSAGTVSKKYAKIASIRPNDAKNTGYSFFASEHFKNFVAEIFDLQLTRFFSSSCHLHEGQINNPSVLGWPHTDLNICKFAKNDNENNYLNNIQYNNHLYSSVKMDYDPDNVEHVVRSAAFLFYLNNKENLKDEDGGGTFIYSHEKDHKIIKTIPPINNSLFLFKVSKKSYHGVQPATFNRYVNTNWFHSDPAEFIHKNFNDFKDQIKKGLSPFEDWDPKNPWNLEKSKNYQTFFKKPMKFLSGEEDLHIK
jgi:hypothetical protein